MEKAECEKKAQLAYSFDIALQNEFSMQENIALARQFLLENFVSRGMVVDFAVHSLDKEDVGISNPHFHVIVSHSPFGRTRQIGQRAAARTSGFWMRMLPSLSSASLTSALTAKAQSRFRGFLKGTMWKSPHWQNP